MNSFESILLRLKESVGDSVSTMEGSFAGDILQATACELARIYSMELDVVTQRAFVKSAHGSWLDAACHDYGVERKENEDDDSLRARTLTKIQAQASSGNEAHYRAWATEVEGVASAQARGRVRGPGTVDVYIVPRNLSSGQDLLDSVFAHIESNRPVCADVSVGYATPVEVDVSAGLVLASSATAESVAAEFSRAFEGYLSATALTDNGSVVSLTRIAGLLMDCTGVIDAKNLRLNGQTASFAVPAGSYAVSGGCSFELAVI